MWRSVGCCSRAAGQMERSKELEILVFRHELAVLRRQPRRALFAPWIGRSCRRSRDRYRGAPGQVVERPATGVALAPGVGQAAHPHRPPGGHRSIVASPRRLFDWRARTRVALRRIVGELRSLSICVSATWVRTILADHGLRPTPQRDELSWRNFLRQHAATTLACDFFTVEGGLAETVISRCHRFPCDDPSEAFVA
jgi:putative transposase